VSDVDPQRLRFLGHVLEAYFAWRSSDDGLGFPEFGNVVGMPSQREARRVLNLSDDQLTLVDGAYAEMMQPAIIAMEYGDSGSTIQKARKLNYSGPNYGAVVGRYRADLLDAECRIFWHLMPDIEQWQEVML